MEKILKPGIYKHFKGNEYQVIGIATHTESQEEFVVYRALSGERRLWIRPLKMFLENVDKDGYKGSRFFWLREKE